MLSICLAYLIFTFREFKSIHKGKTAILHLRFGTEKNRRLGSKKARYNRAFRRRHLFCLLIMARPEGFEPPIFRIGICCVIRLRHGRIFTGNDCRLFIMSYTLNLNRTISPSCITYSLPSLLTSPFSFAAFIEPHSIRSSKDTTSALIKPLSKSEWILPAA